MNSDDDDDDDNQLQELHFYRPHRLLESLDGFVCT